jgi:hypothetical protein
MVCPSNSIESIIRAKFFFFFLLATRPLLRQIENLQTTYISQINSLEKTERQLTDRLCK